MIKEAYDAGWDYALEKVSGPLGGIINRLAGKGTSLAKSKRSELAEQLKLARGEARRPGLTRGADDSYANVHFPAQGERLDVVVPSRGNPTQVTHGSMAGHDYSSGSADEVLSGINKQRDREPKLVQVVRRAMNRTNT